MFRRQAPFPDSSITTDIPTPVEFFRSKTRKASPSSQSARRTMPRSGRTCLTPHHHQRLGILPSVICHVSSGIGHSSSATSSQIIRLAPSPSAGTATSVQCSKGEPGLRRSKVRSTQKAHQRGRVHPAQGCSGQREGWRWASGWVTAAWR